MNIIPTKDVVIEQLPSPITAWTVAVEHEGMLLTETFSETSFLLEEPYYKYIDIEEKNGFSVINGFRCYATLKDAEFVKQQYTRATGITSHICPVLLPKDSHVIRNQWVLFCNEFTVYSSLNTIPNVAE